MNKAQEQRLLSDSISEKDTAAGSPSPVPGPGITPLKVGSDPVRI